MELALKAPHQHTCFEAISYTAIEEATLNYMAAQKREFPIMISIELVVMSFEGENA